MESLSRYLEKLGGSLFSDLGEREAFFAALQSGDADRGALLWLAHPSEISFRLAEPPEWLPDFAAVYGKDESPGKSLEHGRGEIYAGNLHMRLEHGQFQPSAYTHIENTSAQF